MNKKIIISIIIIFLLLAGVAVFWSVQKAEKQEIKEQTQKQVQENSNQQIDLQQPVTEQSQQQDQNQKVYYEIPELGIRFLVDQDMKDELMYSYQGMDSSMDKPENKMGHVYFSTRKLVKIDNECSIDKGPIGTISKIEGKAESYKFYKNRIDKIRQFEGFFIAYNTPQSPCLTDLQKHQEFEQPILQKYSEFFHSEEFLQSVETIN